MPGTTVLCDAEQEPWEPWASKDAVGQHVAEPKEAEKSGWYTGGHLFEHSFEIDSNLCDHKERGSRALVEREAPDEDADNDVVHKSERQLATEPAAFENDEYNVGIAVGTECTYKRADGRSATHEHSEPRASPGANDTKYGEFFSDFCDSTESHGDSGRLSDTPDSDTCHTNAVEIVDGWVLGISDKIVEYFLTQRPISNPEWGSLSDASSADDASGDVEDPTQDHLLPNLA